MRRWLVCCREEASPGARGAELTTTVGLKNIGLTLEASSDEEEPAERLGSTPLRENPAAEPEAPTVSKAEVLPSAELEAPADARSQDLKVDDKAAIPRELSARASEPVTVPSFANQEFLRATSITNVLQKRGRILKNSAGSAETYLLSQPRHLIDIFVSHNWVIPRRRKFLALALYFNVVPAMVVAYIGAAVGCVMNAMHVPPSFVQDEEDDEVMRPHCMILGTCGFFLTLMFAHDFPLVGKLCCYRREVFLDKVCIHQTDPDLKAAGIHNLGAFLRFSRKMLVLFSPVYCKKLWTVYELACYMYLHGKEHIELMPMAIASVVLRSTVLLILVQIASMLMNVFLQAEQVLPSFTGFLIGGAMCIAILCYILRGWARQQRELFSDLRSFHIAGAMCADESDREIVSSNVCAFVHAMGLVEEGASDEDALKSFDKMVQEEMPELLRSAIGPTGMPYKYALVAGLGPDLYALDEITSGLEEMETLEIAATVAHALVLRMAVFPAIFWVCSLMSHSCRPRTGWAEVGVTIGIGLITFLLTSSLFILADTLEEEAAESGLWLGLFAGISVVQSLVVAKLFSWRPAGGDAAAPATLAAAGKQLRESHERRWNHQRSH